MPKRSLSKKDAVSSNVAIQPNSKDYWKRTDIHTLGNTGVGGSLHANVAPLATKIIDTYAYKGKDVRSMVSKDLRFMIKQPGVRIVDLCCGVGISTRALESAFSDAEFIVG